MRFQNRKLAFVALLGVFGLALAESASARTARFRASFDATVHPTAVDSNGDGETAVFAIWRGRSNLGPAALDAWAEFLPWDGQTFCGPTDVQLVYRFVEYSLRVTDGSRLFLVLSSGSLCFDYEAGTFDSSLDVTVIGGTGRFEGATGTLSVHAVSPPAPFPNGLSVFSATLGGTLTLPPR